MALNVEAANTRTIWASFYGAETCVQQHKSPQKCLTANGEIFNEWDMAAASLEYPFGTRLLVEYKGKSVVVRINDRGPYISGRSLDLTKGAAQAIGCFGVCQVTISVL